MRKYHPKVPITKRAAMRSRLIYQYGIDVIETIDLRETAYAITVAIRDLLLDPDERSIARPTRTRSNRRHQIGRAHVRTPVTNAHLVCRLLLEKKHSHIRYHYNAMITLIQSYHVRATSM